MRAVRGPARHVVASDPPSKARVAHRSGEAQPTGLLTSVLVAVMDAIECYMGLVAADGFKTLTADLGRDPVVSRLLRGRWARWTSCILGVDATHACSQEPGISGILLGPKLPGERA